MSAPRSVEIVGGGLAGLTLGIALRQQGIPATICEAGKYPRHRVCGEFISGRGQATLARLGLSQQLTAAGAIPARTVAFFTAARATPVRPLPASALCLSRLVLDATLAQEFTRLGGELRSGQPVRDELLGAGRVRANGRRAQLPSGGERWYGLKIHARNVPLTADLELHVSPQGYVGLCRLSGGEVNVCGLFRRRAQESVTAPREWLRGLPGSPWRQRLAAAEFDETSFCAIAGLSLRPQSALARPEICLGDAITMIPPVTGNGMSMAFESAELALAPLVAWSHGKISWAAARYTIACQCDAQFRTRLRWAKWLQHFLLTPALQNPLAALVSRQAWVWRMGFEHSR